MMNTLNRIGPSWLIGRPSSGGVSTLNREGHFIEGHIMRNQGKHSRRKFFFQFPGIQDAWIYRTKIEAETRSAITLKATWEYVRMPKSDFEDKGVWMSCEQAAKTAQREFLKQQCDLHPGQKILVMLQHRWPLKGENPKLLAA